MTTALAVKKNGADETAPPIDRTLVAQASSAHSRINIGINLANWKGLPEELAQELLWFHQHALDEGLGWKACEEALGYDKSTIFRVLRGTYTGNWNNILKAVRSYKRLVGERASIQRNEFVENSISRTIFAALDYALANNSITIVETESRFGKTISSKAWAERNNHGRAVWVEAPVIGGAAALLRRVAKVCGIKSTLDIADSLYSAFNKNRILIVDEAHRLLPNEFRIINPQKLEFLRSLHDQTGCAIALFVTRRFSLALKKGAYQYEQLVGRIGMPVKLGNKIKRADILPIVRQFAKEPSEALLELCDEMANRPGRLGIMVETLKAASRIAKKDNQKLGEAHVRKAIAMRMQHSGGDENER